MKALLIEDDTAIARVIRRGLEQERFTVEVAADGETGLEMALAGDHTLVILDLMLPKRDGWSVCEELRRRRKRVPILMLTARGAVEDRVRGLDMGADELGAGYTLICGEEEGKRSVVQLRDQATKEQCEVAFTDLIEELRRHLQ